jgi:hypothetical protein
VAPKGLRSYTGPGTGSASRAERPLKLVASHRRSTNSGTASGPHQTMAFCSSRSPRSIACCREMPKTKRLGSPSHSFDGCCPMPANRHPFKSVQVRLEPRLARVVICLGMLFG